MNMAKSPDTGLGHTILKRAAISPLERAITFEGHTQTYVQLALQVRKISAVLRDIGINKGDRVGYIGLNHPSFLEVLYACGCLGAIFVPINFRLTAPEVRFIANDAGVKVIFADQMTISLVDQERFSLQCVRFVSIESRVSNWEFLPALTDNKDPLEHLEQTSADDIALIMYTSGTTGLPKGAMLTHGNLFWNAVNVAFSENNMQTATLTCAPLFHIGGLNVTTLISLACGIEVILHRTFEPGQVLRDLEKYRVSTMFGAPTMFLMMSQHKNFATTDLSCILSVTVGGAPVPVPLIETYGARGISFCQGYGLTETAPYASILASHLASEKIGSAGRPPLYTDICIVDSENNTLPANERGEVCIKGPNVMKGYWNRPEATAEVIDQNGWFHSGDIGYIDNDGFLYLCDRLKDMIISGGENVYPAEVESILYAHEAIIEVAVIGQPDSQWGEAVVAVVVLQPDANLQLEELRNFASSQLARFKLPTRLHFVDVLPRNPAGKVQKFILRKQLAQ